MHESIYDDYLSAFVEHTQTLVVGDPLEARTDIGPMVSAAQREKVVAQVDAALAAGAELVTGGDRAGQPAGHFYSPAVVTGAPAETDLLREETFGPVAPIVRVRSLPLGFITNGRWAYIGFSQPLTISNPKPHNGQPAVCVWANR